MDVSSQLKGAQAEHFLEAGKPATFSVGRIIYTTDTKRFYIGDGVKWLLINPSELAEVKQSMLTEVQFQLENGNEWVLCDGRDVTGSDYASVTGNTTLPDMRGSFVRGKNNGRVDGLENPDADHPLGTYEEARANSVENLNTGLSAALTFGVKVIPLDGTFNVPGLVGGFDGDDIALQLSKFGYNEESRPKSITMNYFVKINR